MRPPTPIRVESQVWGKSSWSRSYCTNCKEVTLQRGCICVHCKDGELPKVKPGTWNGRRR